MQIGVPKETWPGEVRAAMVPANASKLIKEGFTVAVQSGIGDASGYTDADYAAAGATVSEDRSALLAGSDIVMSNPRDRGRAAGVSLSWQAQFAHAATVDRPDLPCYKARCIRGQPADQLGNLLWSTGAAQRVNTPNLGAKGGRLGQ